MEKQVLVIQKNTSKGSFAEAFASVFSSLSIVRKHNLYGYFIIPFLLNIIILSAIFYFSFVTLRPLIYGNIPESGWLFTAIRFIITPLLLIVQAVITILIYSIVGTIITAPFNDFLSQKVEVKAFGEDFDEKLTLASIVADIVRAIGNVLKLLLLIIGVNIILLLLNIIPVLGSLLYTIIGFLTTVFFLGFQFYDFPLERRRFTFGEKLKISFSFIKQILGVGTAFFLLSLIPLVNFLGLNMGTIGATVMFTRYIKPAVKKESL
ncbi:MAG: EI24 domain-containing protein [Spirochaetia bacterium]|jgi:CysZ protein|nr:EI24 domain-containing protein [Spirochaetia bacterium]